MNIRITIPVAVLVVTLAFSSEIQGGGIARQGPYLTVFATGDQVGEVTSCGCPEEDYGGITHKAAFLDTLRSAGWDFLLLDAGDMTPGEGLTAQNRLKIETLARSMATMGYEGIALGDWDLAPGPEHVARLVGWLGQPVLATNYRLPEGTPSERSRVVQVRGKKVGLLAFLDPGLAATAAPWVHVDSWESARDEVKSLAKKTDLVVAVAHAPDSAQVGRLASLFPEIDLVIGAHDGRVNEDIFRQGKSYVVGTPARGRYLTRVEIAFDSTGAVSKMASAFLPVLHDYGRRAKVDTLLAGYHREVRKLVMSDAYLAELSRTLMDPPVAFVGNDACASCHKSQIEQWKQTPHARAHETLIGQERDYEGECQRCHTTGFGFRSGFVSPKTTPKLWNVGCESCHGGGAVHVAQPKEPYGEVIVDACLSCHDSENSPKFDYETYRPRIIHTAKAKTGAVDRH
jgi:hypothetical protein